MIKSAIISIIIFFSIYIELVIGSIDGISFPLLGCAILYITIAYGARAAILSSFIGGTILDILLSRSLFLSPILLILVIIFAVQWLKKGFFERAEIQAVPGAVAATLYCGIPIFYHYVVFDYGFFTFFYSTLSFLISALLGAIIMPLTIILLDLINYNIDLPIYMDAQRKYYKDKSSIE